MTVKRMSSPPPDVRRTSARPATTRPGPAAPGFDDLPGSNDTPATPVPAPLGRVFVVDDDPMVLQALARLFRAANLHVQTFESAAAFFDRVVHDMPSCAVLDLMLPELGGLEIQERLIAMGEDLPLVFLTGQGDVPAAASAMRRGAVDFLVKPTDESELMGAVMRALTQDVESQVQKRSERAARDRYARLTEREKQVCQLVAEGWLNKQIAAALGTAEKTIKQHRGRVMRKLEIQSVAALVRLLSHVPELNVRPRPDLS
jgi:FixJ family two-component response regulator